MSFGENSEKEIMHTLDLTIQSTDNKNNPSHAEVPACCCGALRCLTSKHLLYLMLHLLNDCLQSDFWGWRSEITHSLNHLLYTNVSVCTQITIDLTELQQPHNSVNFSGKERRFWREFILTKRLSRLLIQPYWWTTVWLHTRHRIWYLYLSHKQPWPPLCPFQGRWWWGRAWCLE